MTATSARVSASMLPFGPWNSGQRLLDRRRCLRDRGVGAGGIGGIGGLQLGRVDGQRAVRLGRDADVGEALAAAEGHARDRAQRLGQLGRDGGIGAQLAAGRGQRADAGQQGIERARQAVGRRRGLLLPVGYRHRRRADRGEVRDHAWRDRRTLVRGTGLRGAVHGVLRVLSRLGELETAAGGGGRIVGQPGDAADAEAAGGAGRAAGDDELIFAAAVLHHRGGDAGIRAVDRARDAIKRAVLNLDRDGSSAGREAVASRIAGAELDRESAGPDHGLAGIGIVAAGQALRRGELLHVDRVLGRELRDVVARLQEGIRLVKPGQRGVRLVDQLAQLIVAEHRALRLLLSQRQQVGGGGAARGRRGRCSRRRLRRLQTAQQRREQRTL